MKYILTVLLSLIIISGYSQSKKETEDWVLFNLNKYFSCNSSNELLQNMRVNKVDWEYESYTYSLEGANLIVITGLFKIDSTNNDKAVKITTTKLDLNKILKIDTEKNISTYMTSISSTKVILNFKQPSTTNLFPIKVYNSKKELITNSSSYPLVYSITGCNPEGINNDMQLRMAKALEKLAELNGAQIIKDIF